jgi:hypothetical protein
MIFDLFKLFHSLKKGNGEQGSVEFGTDQLTGVILTPFWLSLLIIVPLMILAGILGFFHVLGGPYGVALFFFWIFIAMITLIVFTMRVIFRKSKKIVKKGVSSVKNIINNKL